VCVHFCVLRFCQGGNSTSGSQYLSIFDSCVAALQRHGVAVLGDGFDGAPTYHHESQQGRRRALTLSQLFRNCREDAKEADLRKKGAILDLISAASPCCPPSSASRDATQPLLAASIAPTAWPLADFVRALPSAANLDNLPGTTSATHLLLSAAAASPLRRAEGVFVCVGALLRLRLQSFMLQRNCLSAPQIRGILAEGGVRSELPRLRREEGVDLLQEFFQPEIHPITQVR